MFGIPLLVITDNLPVIVFVLLPVLFCQSLANLSEIGMGFLLAEQLQMEAVILGSSLRQGI